jgi:uncharacterized membrane protein YgcG
VIQKPLTERNPKAQGAVLGKARIALMGSQVLSFQAKSRKRAIRRKHARGFTLFELILAVALSAALLTVIGMAINLYLTRVDAGRTRVEEAQLARSILAMIADDIRATTVYQKQDTSEIAKLMASGTPFDVDSIDRPKGGAASTGGGSTASSASGNSSAAAGSSSSGTASGGPSASSGTSSSDEPDNTLPLGLSGTLNELYVDATRLPRQEELFATATGYTNASLMTQSSGAASSTSTGAPPGVPPPTDLKTVHYFVRPGASVASGSVAATSLDPLAQAQAGGLVRHEVPRRLRLFAEQMGNSTILDANQALIAPEVVQLEFHYYDGAEFAEVWDMKEKGTLPVAIEVCIWLHYSVASESSTVGSMDLANTAHEYRQTVYLPMSQISSSNQSRGTSASSTASSSSSSNGSGSMSNSGSGFNQP